MLLKRRLVLVINFQPMGTQSYFGVPLRLDYSHEDRAAKGLRAFQPGQRKAAPVYFGAAEWIENAPLLVLHGPAGSGVAQVEVVAGWALLERWQQAREDLVQVGQIEQQLLNEGAQWHARV
ncbi:hypothetical protein LZ023_20775 [Pseudomonas silvicola]|nr:hypothetical protein LZ023_20775 [Pseudomonas silvicola]